MYKRKLSLQVVPTKRGAARVVEIARGKQNLLELTIVGIQIA